MEGDKPKGFGNFDTLMRKLVKVQPEELMSNEQKRLKQEHGTPEQFAIACQNAVADGMISPAECEAAIDKYCREWAEAGKQK